MSELVSVTRDTSTGRSLWFETAVRQGGFIYPAHHKATQSDYMKLKRAKETDNKMTFKHKILKQGIQKQEGEQKQLKPNKSYKTLE